MRHLVSNQVAQGLSNLWVQQAHAFFAPGPPHVGSWPQALQKPRQQACLPFGASPSLPLPHQAPGGLSAPPRGTRHRVSPGPTQGALKEPVQQAD
mmetsp:Transcript_47921/g.136887  ORF Transcript_47921/g.136887 Transcript_47921/m.136887 type:complete len:95 (-) Transcript_47921:499-783(-)